MTGNEVWNKLAEQGATSINVSDNGDVYATKPASILTGYTAFKWAIKTGENQYRFFCDLWVLTDNKNIA